MPEQITNEQGHVGVRRYRVNPRDVKVGDTFYLFRPQHNICFAWVQPEHLAAVLSFKHSCCGGHKKPEFHLASETDVRRWQFGGR